MDAARTRLIEAHLPLAHRCASRFIARLPRDARVDFDAVRSAALEALTRCAVRYDATRGRSFTQFAWQRMWGAMRDELRDADPVSRSIRGRQAQITGAVGELRNKLGRRPDVEEIAAHLGIDQAEIEEVRAAVDLGRVVSLDAPVPGSEFDGEGGNGIEWLRLIAADDDVAGTYAEGDLVGRLLAALPERERFVVYLYYFEQLTQREIGLLLKVTESRVCQLRTKALQRMRAAA